MTPFSHIVRLNNALSGPVLRWSVSLLLWLLAGPAALQAGMHSPAEPCVSCQINGTSPVTQGQTITYTLSGSCTASNWTCSCGTILSYTSTTVTILFNVLTCSTSTITAVGTTASMAVTVNTAPALNGGTISNASQTINYNSIPVLISASAASGGSCGGSYTYQWYSSPDNVTFTAVSGAVSQNYQPGALTATRYYKRQTGCNTSAYTSNTAQVTVYPQLLPGTASPASQSINYNTVPSTLSATGISGGSGTYTYRWFSSPTPGSFTVISGATAATYTPPALTATAYYELEVTSNGAVAYSSIAAVNVYAALQPGSLGPSQAINYGTVPGTLYLTGVTGGSGIYSYTWYYSTNSGSTWILLSGVTGSSYSNGALYGTTEAKVVVASNGAQATSSIATVYVYPQLATGFISPAAQTINYGTAPSLLTLSGTSGGTAVYSYVWQSSAASGGPYQAAGGSGTTFQPAALTADTYYNVLTTSNGVSVTSSPVVVHVYPQLLAGLATPGSVVIAAGTSPGIIMATPASGGACSGSYTYQWQSSPDNSTWTNISGAASLTYSPGNLSSTIYYQLKVSCGTQTAYSNSVQISIGIPSTDLNYIRERDLLRPGVTDTVTADGLSSPADVRQITRYFDGLGRPVQTVAKQVSPLQNDMVSIQQYDGYGREAAQYLPYTASSNDGLYKSTGVADQYNFNAGQFPGEQYYFGQTAFEPTPLNRPSGSYAPGISWAGTGRGVMSQYFINTLNDSVRIWRISPTQGSIPASTGIYPAGRLYKDISTDEQLHQVIVYKDLDGHVILKKVQLSGSPGTAHAGWLCTYYVYDDMGNLRFVIQPRAVELINGAWTIAQGVADELCFRYEYDQRNRMIIKKIPGAGEAWMVYDARDRMVMTQDANLRAGTAKWKVTEYDGEDRPYRTGLLTDPNTLTYQLNNAFSSISYPNTSGGNYEVLTQTYYDDYVAISAAAPALGASIAATYTGNSNYFITGYNVSPTYSQPVTAFPVTTGMATGGMVKVIGSAAQYLYSVYFYDDHGRVIQSQEINYTGGVDTATTQYDFSGKPLRTLLNHRKGGSVPNTVQNHTVLTKMNYDAGFRVKSIWKNIDGASSDQLIDSMQYNELGQLRVKYLGNNIDSLVYDYNIRGWLTGINKNYVGGTTSHYFGMELGYDKKASIAGTTSYLQAAYNGNITGTVWKSAGDGVGRKYDFTYDNVNRLTGAAFLQNTAGITWDNGYVDFSVSNLSYDANGNILSMNQNGFKLGGSVPVDQLTYSYQTTSNKLSQVTDAVNDQNSKLGDFHYNPTTKGTADYSYDGNGNLNYDNNKAIDQLSYNYLNLPQQVHLNTKGTILYTYDAGGTKLKKVTLDSTSRHSTTTLYLGGFVYQQSDSITNPGGGVDTLQFMGHEEGRARWAYHKYLSGVTAYGWEYDFYEKDHLGNTRVLLSQEKDTTKYLASMEAAYRSTENALFYNIPQSSCARIAAFGYPNDVSVTNPNDSVIKVNGSFQKQGPAIILKVMSGDKVDVGVSYYYNSSSATTGQELSAATVINALASGLVSVTGGLHGSFSDLTGGSSPLTAGLTSFLNSNNGTPTGKPNAYLNWMLLDDQFKYVSSYPQSGAVQVGASGTATGGGLQPPLGYTGIPITKSGYLYIYVSNATPGWDVFFDNLSVKQYSGPMVEENHYYPFGLTMAGISDKALKTNYAENKYRFNHGSELQNKEFNDGSGLELYETPLRSLDPQLGRWWQIDSKPHEMFSPYASMANNPILYSDPGGDTTWVFGTQGQYLGTVNDKLKNQVHFVNNDNAKAAPFDASKLSAKEAKSLGQSIRSSSIAFMGSKTASDLKSIAAKSVELKKELGFVGSVGKDREIRLTALPVDNTNASHQVDLGGQVNKEYPSAEQQSGLFLVGHVHQYAASEGYTADDGSNMANQKAFGSPSYPEDYGPFLYRNKGATEAGQSPALVVTPWGATIYGSGNVSDRVTPSNNSYILYQSLKK